ncbi:MAG: WG repeat-containing protein [Bacteroidota bacterium]
MFPVKEYGRWGYINGDGIEVIECKFDYAARFYEGLAAVKVDSLWGFIDQTGKMIILPKFIIPDERFIDHHRFSDGLYRSYKIAPGGYQIFPAVFFKGPYKTKFRFKLNLGDKEVYSNTYTGFMNVSQFISPEDVDKTEISVLAN